MREPPRYRPRLPLQPRETKDGRRTSATTLPGKDRTTVLLNQRQKTHLSSVHRTLLQRNRALLPLLKALTRTLWPGYTKPSRRGWGNSSRMRYDLRNNNRQNMLPRGTPQTSSSKGHLLRLLPSNLWHEPTVCLPRRCDLLNRQQRISPLRGTFLRAERHANCLTIPLRTPEEMVKGILW